jgi:hypothetical protein
MTQQDLPAGQGRMSAEARQSSQGAIPGLWLAAAAMTLSAIVCGTWLALGVGAANNPPGAAGSAASELSQVDDKDVDGAVATLDGNAAFVAQFRQSAGCSRPLAWVSLMRGPGQPPAKIRLQSGAYFSPIFDLSDSPARVAIPYPAPYESGHGSLTAFVIGGRAVVALLPAWQVSEQSSSRTRQVVWHPNKRCQ